MGAGLHAAQDSFFYSWWTPPISQWPAEGSTSFWARLAAWLPVPLPAGMLVMWALFINLSLSLVRRFRYRWRKTGGILTHFGLLLMLAGGLGQPDCGGVRMGVGKRGSNLKQEEGPQRDSGDFVCLSPPPDADVWRAHKRRWIAHLVL